MHDLSKCKIQIWMYYEMDLSLVGQSFLILCYWLSSQFVVWLGHYLPPTQRQS